MITTNESSPSEIIKYSTSNAGDRVVGDVLTDPEDLGSKPAVYQRFCNF